MHLFNEHGSFIDNENSEQSRIEIAPHRPAFRVMMLGLKLGKID